MVVWVVGNGGVMAGGWMAVVVTVKMESKGVGGRGGGVGQASKRALTINLFYDIAAYAVFVR